MDAKGPDSQEVPVDILPPLPKEAYASLSPVPAEHHQIPFKDLRTFYHPASGVVILGLDWLTFGTDFLTGFLALPVICILAFMVSFPVVYVIQLKWSRDRVGTALGKAFLGAFMVALPFPITGTLLGAAILALAGLPHHPIEIVKRLASQQGTASK